MRIICAPDSFKGTLTAKQAAQAMAQGVREYSPDVSVDVCPVADGGEGTATIVGEALHGTTQHTDVMGPLGEAISAAWTLLPAHGGSRDAVIDAASACGLGLVPAAQRNPDRTTSFGLGQLVLAACRQGCTRVIVGLGGTSTVDGGLGMLQAWGAQFFDIAGRRLPSPATGQTLSRIASMDLDGIDPRLRSIECVPLCDVLTPLVGPGGAALVYGPQKGATAEQCIRLDAGLTTLAGLWSSTPDSARVLASTGEDQHRSSWATLPRGGAAGGIATALAAALAAPLVSGIDFVLDLLRFDERVAGSTMCLTGEGRLDASSFAGKAAVGVAERARWHGVPTVAIVGQRDATLDDSVVRRSFAAYVVCGREQPATAHDAQLRITRACTQFLQDWSPST